MRVLWVGTKAPRPPVDGGRLVAATTIDALRAAGHEVTVMTPDAAARRRSWTSAALLAVGRRLPMTIARHADPALAARVATALAEHRFDVVHAEQLQAVANCRAAAAAHGVPVVLRAQNVESELWAWRARSAPWPAALLLRAEARRLARYEGAAVREVAATTTLTARDAARLTALAGGGKSVGDLAPAVSVGDRAADVDVGYRAADVHVGNLAADVSVRHVAAPFPAHGWAPGGALPGDPAVVVPGSADWSPNADAVAWLTSEVWPRIAARLPAAVLHVFGGATPSAARTLERLVPHPPPRDSGEAFPSGAIVVVPLRAAIGVRMRILEAWARGLPVVATPAAADGLAATSGSDVLLASTADAMATAVARLAAEPELRRALVDAGHATLRAHHDPRRVAGELATLYASAARARA